MSKFTKGPWMADVNIIAFMDNVVASRKEWLPSSGYDLCGEIVSDETNKHVVQYIKRYQEAVAARAAVVDLYETLEELLEHDALHEGDTGNAAGLGYQAVIAKARAALAKAKGDVK